MAFSFSFPFLLLFLLLIPSHAHPSSHPNTLLLPLTKDAATAQYLTHLHHPTPRLPLKLVLHLGGPFLWLDCDPRYISSSYSPASCRSPQCSLANANACGDRNACLLSPDNPFIRAAAAGELAEDALSFRSTDGSNPGRLVSLPRFLFSCAPKFLLRGLARGARGMAGLGRTRIGLPSQLAAAFNFHRKFALCLPSSSASNGVIFFGDGPYVFRPGIDVWKSLMYTPLITNPASTAEYFIGLKSIKINGKKVPVNASLLSIDGNGIGGTKISTVNPYTTLETSIYRAVMEAFVRESMDLPRVAPVAPFELCFSPKNVGSTQAGPAVPAIDLVLQSESVYWRMFGGNSMVAVEGGVYCLGFVDGGLNPRTSIVIGGHQLEDNLLQFDLAASRLGFSSSLLLRGTACGNFEFVSSA